MSRYIDADKAMEEINRIGGHNLCEWETIGVKALIDRQPTADVIPRSEIERLHEIINRFEEQSAKELQDFLCLSEKYEKAKQKVAREIFVEIANMMVPQEFKDSHIVVRIDLELLKELRKKYTEGEQDVQT